MQKKLQRNEYEDERRQLQNECELFGYLDVIGFRLFDMGLYLRAHFDQWFVFRYFARMHLNSLHTLSSPYFSAFRAYSSVLSLLSRSSYWPFW